MDFKKEILSVEQQIQRLKKRGLKFKNEEKSKIRLQEIGYYRFRAYSYHFQDLENSNQFINSENISFEKIIELYDFDKRLRKLLFGALEAIEISLRTQLINFGALAGGSHWHLNPEFFKDSQFDKTQEDFKDAVDKAISSDRALSHYKNKYNNPEEPPCWITLDLMSFGGLSRVFKNLLNNEVKLGIVGYYDANNKVVLEHWFQCLAQIRNCVAHHRKIYNRNFLAQEKSVKNKLEIEKNTISELLIFRYEQNRRLYAWVVVIQYLLKPLSSDDKFKEELKKLMYHCPLNQSLHMGFPDDWKERDIWK